MANHKSSLKRIRQTETRRLHNRYYAKTMRNAVRKLRAMTDKTEATAFLPKVQTMLDKLAKNNIIHKNKAANIKSSVTLHVNSLGWSLSARKHIAELREEVRFFCFYRSTLRAFEGICFKRAQALLKHASNGNFYWQVWRVFSFKLLRYRCSHTSSLLINYRGEIVPLRASS